MSSDHDPDAEEGSRYDAVWTAASGLAAVYRSGWRHPQPDQRTMAQLTRGFAVQLSIAHEAARAELADCLCAGCRSTLHYAQAAELASRSAAEEAAWQQRLGDAYYAAHRVALAVGWQWPHIDARTMLAERVEWERTSCRPDASHQLGPLPE